MSTPLVAGDGSLGAMKVYADEPGTFDRTPNADCALRDTGRHLRGERPDARAGQTAQRGDAPGDPRPGRDQHGQGLLMGRNGVDEDTAFRLLLARSEQEGTSVARRRSA